MEGSGYPTKHEQQVWDRHPLEGVTCPVCGAKEQQVSFVGSDLRCAMLAAAGECIGRLLHTAMA